MLYIKFIIFGISIKFIRHVFHVHDMPWPNYLSKIYLNILVSFFRFCSAFSVLPWDSDEEHLGPCPLHASWLVRQCPHIQSPQWILHIFPIQSCKSYTVKHSYSEHAYYKLMLTPKWFSFLVTILHVVNLTDMTNYGDNKAKSTVPCALLELVLLYTYVTLSFWIPLYID